MTYNLKKEEQGVEDYFREMTMRNELNRFTVSISKKTKPESFD